MAELYEHFELGKPEPVQVSSDYILKTYRKSVEEAAARVGKPKPTDEDVIDEFVTVYWAWEVKDD